MKIIFLAKQMPEIAHLSRRDRCDIVRRHHWKAFADWRGVLGFSAYMLALVGGFFLPERCWPDAPRVIQYMAGIAIWTIGILIQAPLYYLALRPHIRKEMSFWKSKGLYQSRSLAVREACGEGGGEGESKDNPLIITCKDRLNTTFRRAKLGMIFGALIGLAGITGLMLTGWDVFIPVLVTGGMALLMTASIPAAFIVCPVCRSQIDSQIMTVNAMWRLTLPDSIRFCSNCGKDFDTEDEDNKPLS